MRLDTTFGKEAKCFSGVGALLYAKDLNFHRFRRAVIDREQLQQSGPQSSSRVIGSSKRVYLRARVVDTGRPRANDVGQVLSPASVGPHTARAMGDTRWRLHRVASTRRAGGST